MCLFIFKNNTYIEHAYDANGNILRDYNKGISTDILYNHLNLPTKITFASGNINYIYDAIGTKLEKVVTAGMNPIKRTKYAGSYVYEKTGTAVNILKLFSQPEGYVEPVYDGLLGIVDFEFVYQYKDHLRNIRLSYRDNGGSLEILEENNYYPFVLEHKGYNNVVNGTENKYQTFQGQELEEELGKNTVAFQWRDYDPAIARFNKIDRFAEKYENITPYHFSANNPIFFREIKGDSINVAELYKKDEDGNYVNASQVKAFEAFAGTKTGENIFPSLLLKVKK